MIESLILISLLIEFIISNASFFVALSVIAACFSAYYAYMAAETSRQSLKGSAIIEITKLESHPDMKEALKSLTDFSNDFSKPKEIIVKDFFDLKDKNEQFYKKIDDSRRLVTQHHLIIYRLFHQNVIKKDDLEDLIDPGQVKVLINIIKPIHKEMGIGFHQKMYIFFEDYL